MSLNKYVMCLILVDRAAKRADRVRARWAAAMCATLCHESVGGDEDWTSGRYGLLS
jgi:hypothetical protein